MAAWLRGFTLIEMLVSLAVLSLALAVVGVVFSVTTKTTSRAAAYSEAHNWVRQFGLQLEEDLRYCDPTQSVMVLVGRTQAAALTADDLQAGKFHRVLIGDPTQAAANFDPEYSAAVDPQYSNPRADLLMFFSQRPTVSAAPNPMAPTGDPYTGGMKFAPVRVMYGHAAFADPVWNGNAYVWPAAGTERHIERIVGGGTNANKLSAIPANRWHLARAATIVAPAAGKVVLVNNGTYGNEWDRMTRGEPSATDPNAPGDVIHLDWRLFLAGFAPAGTATDAALLSAYGPGVGTDFMTGPDCAPPVWGGPSIQTSLLSLLYRGGLAANHHVATVLEDVPVELQGNMAVHMLPSCAWFQVEFLMPEDPRNSVTYGDPNPTSPGTYSARSDMPRWTTVVPGNTYVFVPDTQENRMWIAQNSVNAAGGPVAGSRLAEFATLNPTGLDNVENRIIRTWPYAIRVTVRVWDPRGRLDEPIVRSIIHRFE